MKISNKLLISCYFIIPIVGLFIELNDVTVLLMMWAIAGLVVWTMFRFIKHICDRIIKKLAKIKQQQRTQSKTCNGCMFSLHHVPYYRNGSLVCKTCVIDDDGYLSHYYLDD